MQVKKAFILVNTGSPSELSVGAAKSFLRQFLLDPEVISAPFFIRYPLAYRIASKRAEAYLENLKKISINGVPRLRATCSALARKISSITAVDTFAAYRYGGDSIADAVRAARSLGAREFRFVPMFPQSASSTTLSVKKEVFAHRREGERFLFKENYFEDAAYVSALANSFKKYGDRSLPVLASFHSIPVSQNSRTDYSGQCSKTVEKFAAAAEISDVSLAWQSQMGGIVKWLLPSATETAEKMAKDGSYGINVICPGFACDCTETLIEIDGDLRKVFLGAGGKIFNYIPCLNDSADHAVMFSEIFERMK